MSPLIIVGGIAGLGFILAKAFGGSRIDATGKSGSGSGGATGAGTKVINVDGPGPVANPTDGMGGDVTVQKVYTVKSGDTEWGIAQKLTGDGSRYSELHAVNPAKQLVYAYQCKDDTGKALWQYSDAYKGTGYLTGEHNATGCNYMGQQFKSLKGGEVLHLPATWG